MLKASCNTCGGFKTVPEYGNPNCAECDNLFGNTVEQFTKDNPEAPKSDALYAGRQALMSRAMTATRNFPDPRQISAQRGNFPIPPTRNQ